MMICGANTSTLRKPWQFVLEAFRRISNYSFNFSSFYACFAVFFPFLLPVLRIINYSFFPKGCKGILFGCHDHGNGGKERIWQGNDVLHGDKNGHVLSHALRNFDELVIAKQGTN